MIEFSKINEDIFDKIIRMKRGKGERFVASNAYSLAQAWLYYENNDVYPFAIMIDNEPVGFMMLDEDLEERTMVIWRLLIEEEHQNKGYGQEALYKIIDLIKSSGKYDTIIIDCHPENTNALYLYKKVGFVDTGEINHGEKVLKMEL